jgi:parvulin-like peptidyl-prolyl isomerase
MIPGMPGKRRACGLVLAVACLASGCEDKDPVILRLDGGEVRRSEFTRYLAGIESRGEAPIEPAARAGLLDSFLEDRALVLEARAQGLVGKGATADDERNAVARLLASEVKPEPPSEAEIRAYYGEHEAELARPERVELRQILVATLNEARDVKRRLAKDPKAFDAIARGQSKAPEAERGGAMGVFERGQLPAELEAAAFSLPVGGTSEPIESPLGYHVIRVDSRQAASTPSFEESRDEIRDRLERARRNAAERAYVAGIMARSKVNHAAALRSPHP